MLRLVVFLALVAAAATGLAWLADRPGNLVINWEGYEIETSVFRAVVLLAAVIGATLFVWSILRQIWSSPAAVGQLMSKRRQQRGLEALSSGMIAIGAGDRNSATRHAIQARKALPNEPLTHLLRAQAAQLAGDAATSRRIFEAMLASPDTEQLGLRGLFIEAHREGETEAARQFAERAIALNPKLGWAIDSLFELQCKEKDWAGALETVATARKHGHIEKASADRRRAVLLTAQAVDKEDSDPERALNLAIEAHGLATDLVPAAALAGRMLASRGNTPRATKIIQKTWTRSPHPDLATAYAYARLGDSPRDRFERVRQLSMLNPMSVESAVAAASAAIEAKAFDEGRAALEPFLDGRLTQRICLLMARIEGEQHGNKGRVREWLARAVNAPRDPAWTADGVVSDQWAPVSPVTGALDAFQWRVPLENADKGDTELLQKKLEELVPLGAALDPALAAKPVQATEIVDADDRDGDSAHLASGSPSADRPTRAAAPQTPSRDPRPSPHSERTDVPAAPASASVRRPLPVAEAEVVDPMPDAAPPTAKPSAPGANEASKTAPATPPIRPVEPATAPTAAPAESHAPPAAEGAATRSVKPIEPSPPGGQGAKSATAGAATTASPAAGTPRPESSAPLMAEANAKASAAYARMSETAKPGAAAQKAAATERASTVAVAMVQPSVTTASANAQRTARPTDTRIFVPPRAPDDPGPDSGEPEEVRPPVRGYRAVK